MRTFRIRQHVKGSLWLVPLLGAAIGVALGSADVWRDPDVGLSPGWRYSAGTASGVLTTAIGALVALFGFVVTISVLVVQMASVTLSPRFMRIWYRDRLQKVVLAMFVGTVSFAFVLLRGIKDDSVPSLGVSMAGAAFGICLILLLLYLDRFAHTLRPVGVGTIVGRQGLKEAQHAVRDASAAQAHVARGPNPWSRRVPSATIGLADGGVVLAIQVRGLLRYAVRHDCALELLCAVGDFVPAGAPTVNVYKDGRVIDLRPIAGSIALGHERSIEDDPAFALRIMVDIAIRALSPAVNDPTTGVQLINQIETLIRGLVPYLDDAGHLVISDRHGTTRLVVPVRTFADYLRLAVTEIREYGGSSLQICRRLRAMLEAMTDIAGPAHRPAIVAELANLDRTIAANFPDAVDAELAEKPDRQGIGGT